MATLAHCAYCFESLSASLEKRQPLSLAEIEELWDKYTSSSGVDQLQDEAADAEENDDEDDTVDEDEDMTDVEPLASVGAGASSLKPPPAISRLVAASPASASTNTSSSSIPSTSSASSRSSAPTPASSATSKSSSRSSIFSALRQHRSRPADQSSSASAGPAISSTEAHPLFVTWNTVSRSGNKSLRGCIGTFEAQELVDGLRSYALTSAFDDSRFPPITARELPTLSCAVTLLTNFQPAASPLAWELGRHGLRISFTYHGRRYGATYLPDVAREQGWTKEETIVSLMRKAGWSGRKDEWSKVQLNVVTYEGSKSALGWDEWREWRDWVAGETGVGARREMN